MSHVELNPELHERLCTMLEQVVGLEAHEIGMYLREKVNDDRKSNKLKKEDFNREEFYKRKKVLAGIEFLAVILTKI